MLRSAFAVNKSVRVQAEAEENSNVAKDRSRNSGDKRVQASSDKSMTCLFAPSQVDELCVASKKVDDVRFWLSQRTRARIGLLSGPSGAGKTTVATLLAKELHYEVCEWINPVDMVAISRLGDQHGDEQYSASHVALFQSFLFHASRYKSVFSASRKRLLLVEDFPNALIADPVVFTEILEEYTKYGTAPLLFIISNARTGHLNMQYKLFPDQLKERLHIAHVEFNAVSNTLMQKAMKRFCKILGELPAENYKVPSKDVIDSIVLSSQGDIRNAVINLHFAAIVCNGQHLETVDFKVPSAPKPKKGQQRPLKSIGCDKSISSFHALGRVFNPKLDEQQHFVHKPEEIAEDFTSEPRKFQNLIFANYAQHFSDIENIADAADAISLADNMLSEYREHDLTISGLDVCVRGLMVNNKQPAAGWRPICKAKYTEKKQTLPQWMKVGESYWLPESVYHTDCGSALKIIKTQQISQEKIIGN